jgi:hypothetical protein
MMMLMMMMMMLMMMMMMMMIPLGNETMQVSASESSSLATCSRLHTETVREKIKLHSKMFSAIVLYNRNVFSHVVDYF